MGYTDPTLKKLFALSGNVCAFPGCSAPIVDTDMDVVVGDICHIKGKSENGPRYDPDQPESERDGYQNLLVMCVPHNRIVDGKKTQHLYPVEVLREYKRNHEAQYQGSVVDTAALDAFTEHFTVAGSVIVTHNQSGGQNAHTITNIFADPPKPKASLTPVVTSQLDKVGHQADLDFYTVRIALRNDGTKTVREFAIEVEIPETYMENAGSYAANVNPKRPGTKMFRHTQQNFGQEFALYSGDSYPVFSLGFVLKKGHYLQGIRESIRVSVYENDEPVSVTEHPMADMLNAERVEMIFGPRRGAIKKIYEAARSFQGDDGDLTQVAIFLADGPVTGKRGVQLKDAYNMALALAKVGWLVIENHEMIMVQLTEDGIRAAI
jgi:hypothetical protein